MTVNPQLLLFSLPSCIYLVVLWWQRIAFDRIRANLGWCGCRWADIGLAALIVVIGLLLAALTYRLMPAEALLAPGSAMSHYAGWKISLFTLGLAIIGEGIFSALGEEVFFRGLLGGWLQRRFGFSIGNALQTLAFLLPHLALLLIDVRLWPSLIAPLILGWLFGWARYRSGSILPSWFAHTLINALGFLLLQP